MPTSVTEAVSFPWSFVIQVGLLNVPAYSALKLEAGRVLQCYQRQYHHSFFRVASCAMHQQTAGPRVFVAEVCQACRVA